MGIQYSLYPQRLWETLTGILPCRVRIEQGDILYQRDTIRALAFFPDSEMCLIGRDNGIIHTSLIHKEGDGRRELQEIKEFDIGGEVSVKC